MKLLLVLMIFMVPLRAETADPGKLVTIASFSTSVEDQDEAVKKNIHIACKKLNGYILMPKAMISFNEVVGEGSARNGFVNGRVLYRDEIRYEPGGGICQVSSTLYNALLAAGCTIAERHRHFQPVSYVPPGLDATIKYGKKDLKMNNPGALKLRIETALTDKSLSVLIKAENAPPVRYELATEEEEVELPVQDENRRVRNGIHVSVYRNSFSGTKLLESFLLYRDYYPPVYLK